MSDNFSERLRAARELRKMNQTDLATAAKLQPSAVSHFETGRRSPSFANLRALADALKVTTDYLIGRSDHPDMSSAVSSKLLRNAEKMSAEDLKTLESMSDLMAKKQNK
jgi:transcriptional regulator with XRE-family HTH domain